MALILFFFVFQVSSFLLLNWNYFVIESVPFELLILSLLNELFLALNKLSGLLNGGKVMIIQDVLSLPPVIYFDFHYRPAVIANFIQLRCVAPTWRTDHGI